MSKQENLRIVHCVRAPIGGIFRHVVDLALAQTAAGHAVGIVCDSLTGGSFEADWIARVAPRLAFGITRFPMRRALTPADFASLWRLWRHVVRLDPDVVHGHGSKGGSYARLIGTAMRLERRRPMRIYCPHGGSLHFDARSVEGRIYFALERLLERMSDGLVFVSEFERRTYLDKIGVPHVPSILAYNGLRPEEFEPVRPDAAAVDFLHIGMLRALKGTDVFVEAIGRLRDRGVAARGLIVGVGDERPTFEAQVHRLGLEDRIAFRDPMPIRDAMRLARTVVLPSRAESLPYVVLEALAAGVPLIATRVGGIPEIYEGRTDELIAAGDVEALAAVMQRQLTHREEALDLTAALRRSIAERFTVETMMRTIEAFYFRLRDPVRTTADRDRGTTGDTLRRVSVPVEAGWDAPSPDLVTPEAPFSGAQR